MSVFGRIPAHNKCPLLLLSLLYEIQICIFEKQIWALKLFMLGAQMAHETCGLLHTRETIDLKFFTSIWWNSQFLLSTDFNQLILFCYFFYFSSKMKVKTYRVGPNFRVGWVTPMQQLIVTWPYIVCCGWNYFLFFRLDITLCIRPRPAGEEGASVCQPSA